MWKQNYSNLFEKSNSNLTILKKEKIPYKEKGLFDQAYLFEK